MRLSSVTEQTVGELGTKLKACEKKYEGVSID